MDLATALTQAHELDEQAAAGWPKGYSARRVTTFALTLDRVLVREATSAERAREIVASLNAVECAW